MLVHARYGTAVRGNLIQRVVPEIKNRHLTIFQPGYQDVVRQHAEAVNRALQVLRVNRFKLIGLLVDSPRVEHHVVASCEHNVLPVELAELEGRDLSLVRVRMGNVHALRHHFDAELALLVHCK